MSDRVRDRVRDVDSDAPVITVDGPSGVGKGTLARALAHHLGFGYLDSGSLYRLTALAVLEGDVDVEAVEAVAAVAAGLDVDYEATPAALTVRLAGSDVSQRIRGEDVAAVASRLAAYPEVRAALLTRQRGFRRAPGLVGDGRDLGTVVFPDASLKLFLGATARVRALRRQHELQATGRDATLDSLMASILDRDRRDRERTVSPLRPAADAIAIDTSEMSIKQVFERALALVREHGVR